MSNKLPIELEDSTILIVDDMSFYVSLIGQILANSGFRGKLLTATKLSEAFESINEQYKTGNKIGLIIADLHLPDGLGTKLAKKIREVEMLSKIPFILITTEDNSKQIIHAFEAGVDNYIFKPLEDNVLLEKINFAYTKYHKKLK